MNGTSTSAVSIPCNDSASALAATLAIPPRSRGIVVVVDAGSGAGADSERCHPLVASALQEASFATLQVSLLLPGEPEEAGRARFDMPLLAARLSTATDWLSTFRAVSGQPLGFFGAGTGAAAALLLAAQRSDVRAVVSQSGRLDLVITHLDRIGAPTLLIVGGADEAMQRVSRQALPSLHCTKEMILVPGAGHLFQEAGAMAHVAAAATSWLVRHLASPATT